MTFERMFAPRDAALPTRKDNLVAAVVCAVLACVIYWRYRELRHDDAFIAFQYARNLATGNGLVFNPGERVLGTTSPLHALLMAMGYAVVGEALPKFAVFIGAVGVGLQGLFIYVLLRPRSAALAAILAILVLCGFAGGLEFLALETQLFAAAVLATVWSLRSRRPVICGVLLGVAFLLRYDAALLVPIVALSWWIRWRELPRITLVVSFAVVVPWLAWATWYFGSFLPQTFFAKQQITPTWEYLTHYADHFGDAVAGVLLLPQSPAVRVVSWCAAVSGGVFALRRARAFLPFFAFAALLTFAYGWMGPHHLQHWHLQSARLAFVVAFFLGTVGWTAGRANALSEVRIRRVALAGIVVVCFIVGGRVGFAQLVTSDRVLSGYWLGQRHARYVEVANWVREHVRPDRSFLALEVGTLGYLTRLKMIDPYGLINETNSYARDPTLESLLELMDRYGPDVVLVNTPEQGLAIENVSPYRVVKVFKADPLATLLVRQPEALTDASSFNRLRSELGTVPR